MVANRAMLKLLPTVREKGETAAARCALVTKLNPSVPVPPPKQAPPLILKETFEGTRAKGKTTDYSMKLWDMWQRLRVKKHSMTLSQT